MNKVIAIVGMAGAGKSDAAAFFRDMGCGYVHFGSITLDELRRRNLETNEKNERMVREGLRQNHGMAVYAKLSIPKLEAELQNGHVVADGLYGWAEYLALREKFGMQMIVLAIYASPKTRAVRLSKRPIRPLTKEELDSRDRSEIENLGKGGPIAVADYTINNEVGKEEFLSSLEKFWKKIEEVV